MGRLKVNLGRARQQAVRHISFTLPLSPLLGQSPYYYSHQRSYQTCKYLMATVLWVKLTCGEKYRAFASRIGRIAHGKGSFAGVQSPGAFAGV